MARRRRRRGRKRGLAASLVARPWLVLLVAGLGGFVVIRYVMGPLVFGVHNPYLDPLGESLHAGALGPLAWLWLLVCLGASLALFAKAWRRERQRGRPGSRRRRRRRSRHKRKSRTVSQAAESAAV